MRRRIQSSSAAVLLCLFLVVELQICCVNSLHRHHDVHRCIVSDKRHKLSSISNVSRGGGRSNDVINGSPPPSSASKGTLQAMRLLYLTYYASLGALMPYLPVYYHSLGHKGTSIGLLGAVKPLTTFLAAPVWGIISDRSGNHVSTLQFTFLTSLVCQMLVGMNSNLTFLIMTVFITALLNAPVKSLIDSIVMR